MKHYVVFSIIPLLFTQAVVGHTEVRLRRELETLRGFRAILESGPVKLLQFQIRMLDIAIGARLSQLLLIECLYYGRKRG